LIEDSGWAELLRRFGTQTSAGIKYGVPGITHRHEMGRMNINDILTEIEYTKERSAKELFEWFTLKNEELSEWCQEHSETKALREIKYRNPSRLFDKFAHELAPFAYYVKTQYSNKLRARFKPCCGSEPYDGRIIDNGDEIFVEITNAIDGKTWSLQKELLIENGHSP